VEPEPDRADKASIEVLSAFLLLSSGSTLFELFVDSEGECEPVPEPEVEVLSLEVLLREEGEEVLELLSESILDEVDERIDDRLGD
jgi:hypothetical protein